MKYWGIYPNCQPEHFAKSAKQEKRNGKDILISTLQKMTLSLQGDTQYPIQRLQLKNQSK